MMAGVIRPVMAAAQFHVQLSPHSPIMVGPSARAVLTNFQTNLHFREICQQVPDGGYPGYFLA
jgi:hypothetical protein